MVLLFLLQLMHAAQDPGGSWTEFQSVLSPQPAARFGYQVELLGDLNQDSCADYLVGATEETVQGMLIAGAIYVISGRDGQILRTHPGLAQGDLFGWSNFSVGDVNQDGVPEYGSVAHGAPRGAVAVRVFDGSTGALLHQVLRPLELDSRSYGNDASFIGDWNADGIPDYAVSDYFYGVGALDRIGRVYFYSGLDGTLIDQMDGFSAGHGYGASLCGGGDVNGDGRLDLLIKNDWGSGGSVDVIDGATGSMLYRLSSLTGNGYLGTGLDFVPDLDGDGGDEILVGAGNAGTYEQGEAYLFSGRTGVLLYRWYGETKYRSYFGDDVAYIGDLDLDGVPDWAVGSPFQGFPASLGKVFFYSGVDGRQTHSLTEDPNAVGYLGNGMDGGMDTNGDGRMDVLLSQNSLTVNGVPSSGVVNVLSFDPYLDASDRLISSSSGGTITFAIDFPPSEAAKDYRLLTSTNTLGDPLLSGKPWLKVHGVQIPLVETPWLYRSWNRPPLVLTGAQGTLDTNGDATATLTLSPGAATAAVGHTFRLAAVSLDTSGFASISSAAVLLTIEP